jgi:hypothetical protein
MKKGLKTQTERLKEMIELYKQLENVGITNQFEEMKKFYEDANTFVKEGTPITGAIPLASLQRVFYYELFAKHPKPSQGVLKAI